jgi:hypothetical protein
MKEYEIISIEPTSIGKYWMVTYKTAAGKMDNEMVEGLDSNEASIAFSNLMIRRAKLLTPQKSRK